MFSEIRRLPNVSSNKYYRAIYRQLPRTEASLCADVTPDRLRAVANQSVLSERQQDCQ